MVQRKACKGSVVRRCFLPRARDRPMCRAMVCLLCIPAGILAAGKAHAADFTAGLSGGGFYAAGRLIPALSPHLGVSWRTDSGWLFVAQEILYVLPGEDVEALGVYNHLTAGVGRAWEKGNFNLGIALPTYVFPACYGKLCGLVGGVGLGAYAQADFFWLGPLGLSLRINVDWLGGRSLSLPGSLAAMGVAGPVVQW